MVIKDGLGNTCWNFCNRPIVLFTLVKTVLIWMSKDNFESKCSPKCFWESTLLTGILLKNILGWIFLVENRDASSANNLGLHWRLSDKSLMYIRNKSGPNIKPWGTPALILAQDELWPLRITLCFLFLRSLLKGLINLLRSRCV